MGQSTYTIFLRDLTLDLVIGIYEHEKTAPQRVGILLEATMTSTYGPENFLNYDKIMDFLTKTVPEQSYPLQEDLALHIQGFVMSFSQVLRARIEISKPDAYGEMALIGVRLDTIRSAPHNPDPSLV